MKRSILMVAGNLLLVAGLAFSGAVGADFDLVAPDGRQIRLMDNGTWKYLDAKDKDQPEGKTKVEGESVLSLERRIERGANCRFVVRLVNNFPYEIKSLVPYYSAYRADGVIYDTVASLASFASMKPGDSLSREFDFAGIACRDIIRLQVVGGDRCDMGDLDKFAATKGQCLARVRVVPSDLVRFDK
jgi:hypothetical protein